MVHAMRRVLATVLIATFSLTAQQVTGGAFDQDQWNSAIGVGERKGKYSLRGSRRTALPAQAAALQQGLSWLRDQQEKQGCWPCAHSKDAQVGVTALALLTMLGDGSTMRSGPWKKQIKLGVRWLRERQQPSGAFADATGPHLLAALAMTECYMLSNYRLIRKCAANACAHAVSLRAEDGGWRAFADEQASDPALTLWGTTLLVAAVDAELLPAKRICKGIPEWLLGPRATLAPSRSILGVDVPLRRQGELVYDQPAANAFNTCWVAFDDPDPKTRAAMMERSERTCEAALQRIRKIERNWESGKGRKLSMHEWFCSAHLFAQLGDKKSLTALYKALIAAQAKQGDDAGSWEPVGVWGESGGRVWTTAMAVLALESTYRYAKITGQ